MEAGVWRDAARSGPKVQGTGEGEREAQEAGGRSDLGQSDSQVGAPGVQKHPRISHILTHSDKLGTLNY